MSSGGTFIGHMEHTEGTAPCGSSDGLALYDNGGKHTGYCWACGKYEPDPLDEQTSTPKPIQSKLAVKVKSDADRQRDLTYVYNEMPILELRERGISKATCEYFGVRAAVSQEDGLTVAQHYYPLTKDGNLVAYKVRRCADKQFYSLGFAKDTDLFGQHQAAYTNAKQVIVTEGEIDAMSVFQAIREQQAGTKYEHFLPAVVSLVRGAAKEDKANKVVNELGQHAEFFGKFETIVVCLDQDAPGLNSAQAVSQLFPGKVKIVDLPMKDANAMLMAGKSSQLQKAVLFQGKVAKLSSIRQVSDVFEQARAKAEWGKPWPWSTLNKMTYGRRRGELIGVGAGVGCGKTTFWHQITEYIINDCSDKVGVFMLEEANAKTLKMLAGKFAGKQFHNPDVEYEQQELDDALMKLDGKLVLYDNREESTWESIGPAIRHMVLVEGCKDIILDPISALTFHLDSSKTNDELNRIFGEVAAMAKSLDFTLYYSSHLNAPEGGKPHEEGGRVKASQFTGSRAMIKWSHYIIGLERDTQADEEEERNQVTIRVLKDREYGNTGIIRTHYDHDSGSLIEEGNWNPPADQSSEPGTHMKVHY